MDPLAGARREGGWLVADGDAGRIEVLEYDTGLAGFVDVHLYTIDGKHYVGTFGTVDDVVQLMARWRETGECLGGRYLWMSDLVIVDNATIATIVATIDHLAAQGELHAIHLVTPDEEGDFAWGDTVRVRDIAPAERRPGQIGAVVGLPTAPRVTYTIEFGDGSDAELPASLLILVEPYQSPE